MTENDRRQNPFDRPKPKLVTLNSTSTTKKIQMQKMDNFRDKLNQQLFGNDEDTTGTFTQNEEVNIVNKAPPKQYKRPEVFIKKEESSKNIPIEEDIFNNKSSNSELKTNFNSVTRITNENSNDNNNITNPNVSFSEENCNSIHYSENKNENKSDSSHEKRKVEPFTPQVINTHQDHQDNQDKEGDKIITETNPTHSSMSSQELSEKLDKFKSEIRELRLCKSTLDTNYQIEINKNKLYENELEELRRSINHLKIKEITQSESLLKLEIENLNNNVDFRKKENNLLRLENQSLINEVKKLQSYIKEILNNRREEENFNYEEKEEDVKESQNEERENINVIDNNNNENIENDINKNDELIQNENKNENEEVEYDLLVDEMKSGNSPLLENITHDDDNINNQIINNESELNNFNNIEILDKNESPISEKNVTIPNRSMNTEKNLFQDLTYDMNDVFKVNNLPNLPDVTREDLLKKNTLKTVQNVTNNRPNLIKKNEPLIKPPQNKKLNQFAFDLHTRTIFGNLTKSSQNIPEQTSNLFD